jgi:hemolysin-activating ACP:hemolysin acyltransferase
MFGFGKRTAKDETQSIAQQIQTITPRAPAVTEASTTESTTEVRPIRAPAQNAEHSRKMSGALGDIVSVFAQSATHERLTLKDIGPMILPALSAGQYKVAIGQDEQTGFSRPLAAVLWARVSDDMDQTLQANPIEAARLAPDAWTGGNRIWIVEAVGAQAAIAALTSDLQKTAWRGQDVKYRAVGPDGTMTFATLPS